MNLLVNQLQTLVGIKRDTWRVWKDAMDPIKDRDGRSTSTVYTAHEALALKVVAYLVKSGVQVSAITPSSADLFKACELPWAALADLVLVIDVANRKVEHHRRGETRTFEQMAGLQQAGLRVVPLYQLAHELQQDMLPAPVQAQLALPPVDAETGARQ